jgi:hypothetical protein
MSTPHYPAIRPGVAVSISAATLVAGLVIGVALLRSLTRASAAVRARGDAAAALHGYSAALEVWREKAAGGDPGLERPEARDLRDSIRAALTVQFRELKAEMPDSTSQALAETVIESLRQRDVALSPEARQAMAALLARQDSVLLAAAEDSQNAVLYVAMLLALTVVAAGTLGVPIAWFYIRYKRRAIVEAKA